MPVILPAEHWDRWLDPEQEPPQLRPLLVPAPETLLEVHPVSTKVNSVRHNEPELIHPVPLEE
jgi:putative SOS response-associated peptidase YedK